MRRKVQDVIITHLHYDHGGNLDLFPRARFHLQDREMAYATGRYMGMEFFSYAYEAEDVVARVRRCTAGASCFTMATGEVAPGLTVHHIGGHTRGLQAVRVWTRVRLARAGLRMRLTIHANMIESRPFPVVAERHGNGRRVAQAARRSRARPSTSCPGHDPLVMRRYRAPRSELEGIAVRLDDRRQDSFGRYSRGGVAVARSYDIVAVGSGHNGLVAAAYLGGRRQESPGAGAQRLVRRRRGHARADGAGFPARPAFDGAHLHPGQPAARRTMSSG